MGEVINLADQRAMHLLRARTKLLVEMYWLHRDHGNEAMAAGTYDIICGIQRQIMAREAANG